MQGNICICNDSASKQNLQILIVMNNLGEFFFLFWQFYVKHHHRHLVLGDMLLLYFEYICWLVLVWRQMIQSLSGRIFFIVEKYFEA